MSLTGNNILGGSGHGTNQPSYKIDQSLRFNKGDSPYLSKTLGTPTDGTRWTVSAWVKKTEVGNAVDTYQYVIGAGSNSNNRAFLRWDTTDHVDFQAKVGGYWTLGLAGAAQFRDPAAWFHILANFDSNAGTADVYVNGSKIVYDGTETRPSDGSTVLINTAVQHVVGADYAAGTYYWNNYIAEVHFIDGQDLDPSSFGKEDSDTGHWKPIEYTGTYGDNGFYQKFQDSSALGDDSSGNGNDFTSSGLVATDVVKDSPTNNYCTFNPLDINPNMLLSNGNLYSDGVTANWEKVRGTFGVSSGKYYWELNLVSTSYGIFGVADSTMDILGTASAASGAWAYSTYGTKYINGAGGAAYGATCTTGDIIGVALDMDGGNIEFFKNDTSQGELSLGLSGNIMPYCSLYTSDLIANFGQDSSFAGNETAQGNTDSNGEGDFYYEPPSGFLALCSDNLPDPSIADPTAHFNTVLYTGNSSTNAITGVGFQPDFTWIKSRSDGNSHGLFDSPRGVTKELLSNDTAAEQTFAASLTSFDSDGFSLGADAAGGHVNISTRTYVGWNWKGGGAAVSNGDGSLTSSVSANADAGFSIATFTTDSTTGIDTVGHGLSEAPTLIFMKNRTNAYNWDVYQVTATPSGVGRLKLNSTDGMTAQNPFGSAAPTSSVFTYSQTYNGSSGNNIVAYCFHSVEGYSKVGSYTANNSADGVFLYCGFSPAFFLVKCYSDTTDWIMFDNKRNTYNVVNNRLEPNTNDAEDTDANDVVDFVSNGIKIRGNGGGLNYGTRTQIYLAFASTPFTTANAR